ncbi:hypothetical protein HELRODRAFT_72035, partial [Helobdella robusta]|uniref:CBS domain-containing protein n=1 Tax=Helobdella robusta TaxID=6412 RepID=T1G0U3_HELRO
IRRHTVYDAMPNHARVIILDLNLKVGSAFDALAYDGIHAAPLWDNDSKEFVGMITVTDFISILQQFLHQPVRLLASIRDDKVCKWRDHLSSSSSNCMLTIKADSNLDDLITHLDYYHIHRVVAVDASTKNALYIATYRRILHYIWSKVGRGVTTNVFNRTLQQVNLGSYMDLVSVSLSTPVHEIFSILMSRRLSAVPVVDDCYRVVDVFRKADVMSLIIDGSFHDLYCPVEDVLLYERNGFEGLYKCKKTDVVYNVIHSFVHLELHRLVVVDDEDRLEGVITTSDIIKFFLDGDHTSMVSSSSSS